MPVVVQRQVPGHGLWLCGVHHHVPVHGGLWTNIFSWVLLARFALESWCIIPLRPCIWQPLLGVWLLHVVYRFWILREMTLSMGAMLGSTVDMESATVLGFCFYDVRHIFYECGRLESMIV